MVKSQTTSITPAQHADNHRHGGTDPLTGDVRIDHLVNIPHHSGAEVFNAGAPAGYTNLDLSGIVGANEAMVCLNISAGDNYNYHFKPEGGSNDDIYIQLHPGNDLATPFWIVTNNLGIVQWYGNSNVTNTVIFLSAYYVT